ncbi:hypothetical protein AB1Y20_010146 [Prymnesium parvum]|uniref:Uncharacterized protein n=1 Tax=Prymnesium parvum TaxID=97485 RepID=A0AB34K6L6_PRYPA
MSTTPGRPSAIAYSSTARTSSRESERGGRAKWSAAAIRRRLRRQSAFLRLKHHATARVAAAQQASANRAIRAVSVVSRENLRLSVPALPVTTLRYLRSVYGADEPVERLHPADLSFFYRSPSTEVLARHLCAPSEPLRRGCRAECDRAAAAAAAANGGARWPAAPSQRRCSLDPTHELGRVAFFVAACAANESRQREAADGGWLEVMRLAPPVVRAPSHLGGCWFWVARGSGVFLNVGRSLRVETWGEAAAVLLPPRHARGAAPPPLAWASRGPSPASRHEEVCERARAAGLDTIQIGGIRAHDGFGAKVRRALGGVREARATPRAPQVVVCSARLPMLNCGQDLSPGAPFSATWCLGNQRATNLSTALRAVCGRSKRRKQSSAPKDGRALQDSPQSPLPISACCSYYLSAANSDTIDAGAEGRHAPLAKPHGSLSRRKRSQNRDTAASSTGDTFERPVLSSSVSHLLDFLGVEA